MGDSSIPSVDAITEAHRIVDGIASMVSEQGETIQRLHERNQSLRTENERLREALKPFVPDGDYHPVLDGPVSDECAANANFWFDTTVGDIRRARAALEGEG